MCQPERPCISEEEERRREQADFVTQTGDKAPPLFTVIEVSFSDRITARAARDGIVLFTCTRFPQPVKMSDLGCRSVAENERSKGKKRWEKSPCCGCKGVRTLGHEPVEIDTSRLRPPAIIPRFHSEDGTPYGIKQGARLAYHPRFDEVKKQALDAKEADSMAEITVDELARAAKISANGVVYRLRMRGIKAIRTVDRTKIYDRTTALDAVMNFKRSPSGPLGTKPIGKNGGKRRDFPLPLHAGNARAVTVTSGPGDAFTTGVISARVIVDAKSLRDTATRRVRAAEDLLRAAQDELARWDVLIANMEG